MYERAMFGQTWVSKDKVRWTNWTGRQIYKYRYTGPKQARS